MAHEHQGNCCDQHEHMAAEQLHHLTANMGSLCCSGQCHHIEHQVMAAQFEYEHFQEHLATQEEVSSKTIEKKAKRKKKTAAHFFVQLLKHEPSLQNYNYSA